MSKTTNKFSPEVRERAVRLVLDGLIAVQQVLDIAQRQREPHIHHHSQADDFGRGFEVPEWISLGHPATLSDCPAPF